MTVTTNSSITGVSPLTAGLSTTLAAGGSTDAANAITFGDSMTNFWEVGGVAVTAATYDQSTGVITCTATNHLKWTGAYYRIWHFTYPSLNAGRRLPITRVDANTFTITLVDKPTDLPNGAISTTNLFILPDGCASYTHWLGLAQLRLGHRLRLLADESQNGETSVQGLARIGAVLATYPTANLVIWQLHGLNDQSSTYAYSEETSIAANRAIIDTVVASGKKALILSTTPVASGEARGSLATMQRIKAINADAEEYSRKYGSVAFVDAYSLIVDPTNVTGYAVASYLRAGDKIHYLAAGASRVATPVQSVIQTWFPTYRSKLNTSTANSQSANKVTVSSVVRAGDGITVTLTTTGAHGWRVGEKFRANRMIATENGVFTVASVPTTTSITYINPGAIGSVVAGSAHFTRSRQAFSNTLLQTVSGGTTGTGILGTAASLLAVNNLSGATLPFATASVVAAPNGPIFTGIGNEQKLEIASVGVGTQLVANGGPRITNAGTTTLLNDMLPNRKYRFSARVRLASADWALTPISQVLGSFTCTWSTGELYSATIIDGWDGTETATITTDQDWHVVSTILETVPPQGGSTMAAVDFSVYARASAAHTSTLTFAMSQITVTDVTDAPA